MALARRTIPALLLLPFLLASLWPAGLGAEESYTGQVVAVADGDTITVLTTDYERIKVRFYGIDCPEKAQPYGAAAKSFLNDMIYGKTVSVRVMDVDRYSRYVGVVTYEGKSVNDLMLRAGYAWLYSRYCKDTAICGAFRSSEREAKAQGRGLWKDPNPTAPWDWRRKRR
jgi:endonuclease YncB( thermonuclease family)